MGERKIVSLQKLDTCEYIAVDNFGQVWATRLDSYTSYKWYKAKIRLPTIEESPNTATTDLSE